MTRALYGGNTVSKRSTGLTMFTYYNNINEHCTAYGLRG